MKVFGLLSVVAGLLVAISACPPPLNDPRFIGNATHTTSEIIKAFTQQRGENVAWTEVVLTPTNREKPWPKSLDNLHTLLYCYTHEPLKRYYDEYFVEAVQLWHDKLGPPGEASGHSFQIREVPVPEGETNNPSCLLSNGQWNPKVPSGTLVIKNSDSWESTNIWTTLGYKPEPADRHLLPQPERNVMAIGSLDEYEEDLVAILAHELGHAIGLYHEHQREDRDTWLSFKCESLIGYDDMVRRILAYGKDEAYAQKVCEDPMEGYKWDFIATQFSKFPFIYPNGLPRQIGRGIFDPKSIMLYEPRGDQDADVGNECIDAVLTHWVPYATGSTGKERTVSNSECPPKNMAPSDGDRDGVKFIYPFPA